MGWQHFDLFIQVAGSSLLTGQATLTSFSKAKSKRIKIKIACGELMSAGWLSFSLLDEAAEATMLCRAVNVSLADHWVWTLFWGVMESMHYFTIWDKTIPEFTDKIPTCHMTCYNLRCFTTSSPCWPFHRVAALQGSATFQQEEKIPHSWDVEHEMCEVWNISWTCMKQWRMLFPYSWRWWVQVGN